MTGKSFSIPSRTLVGHHMATDWGLMVLDWEYLDAAPCAPLPDIDFFRTRFPEFVDLPDTQVQTAIDAASCWADSSWIQNGCNDCTKAIAYLAAHFLALWLMAAQMLPETLPPEEPGGPVILPGGEVTSIRFETMSVGFSPSRIVSPGGGQGTSGIGDQWAIGGTPYGQMYLMLVKVNKPAVLVV